MEEETFVYSIVSKGEGAQPEEGLQSKLAQMAGVSQAAVSVQEGRVSVTGQALHPEAFVWALEQSGYQVLNRP